jgi:carbamoyl-phosphate synthase small subunit
MSKQATLQLSDGAKFHGTSCGIEMKARGEVVFNTSLTGYQEICTDPSYEGQIVVFTAPHIGNVGVNDEDWESKAIFVKGIIVKEMSKMSSSWRSRKSFPAFLKEHQIPWIEGVDTRALTRHLRENGTKRGCLQVGKGEEPLASISKKTDWQESPFPTKIALFDFGVKTNILKKISAAGCAVKIFPGHISAKEILAWNPSGVVISNGPGDPAAWSDAIQETKKLIASGLPLFGICLGCQLIALAMGGGTMPLKYGHHGTNHPVCDLLNGKVYITSQNHQFAIDENKLPSSCTVTHRSLFDGTVQGIRVNGLPVFGFQGHPEGSPGPQELDHLFEEFLCPLKKS